MNDQINWRHMFIVMGFVILYVIVISISAFFDLGYRLILGLSILFWIYCFFFKKDPGDKKQEKIETMTTTQKILNIALLIFLFVICFML